MRNIWKKLTASLLALVLTVQLLPVSALADEFDQQRDAMPDGEPIEARRGVAAFAIGAH